MDHSKQLGEDRIAALLIRFSLPAIIGMLVNALYNVVDRIFVGHAIGRNGIAGITIGFPFMILMMAFAMLIGIGANTLVSIRLGEGRKAEAELIIGNAFILLVGLSLLLTLGGLLFLDPLLRLFGASQEVLPYARQFMHVILLGTVFQGIGFGMNNFIRGEGNPRIAMLTMLIGAVLNAILCPIFLFGFKWGIQGSAAATVISWAVSGAWVLRYFTGGGSTLKLRTANFRLQFPIVKQIVTVGSAPFAMQIAASLLTVILNKSLIQYGGDVAISALGIVNSLAMLIMMPIFGINQGAQPIIGYNYGAHNFDRVRKTLTAAIAAATGVVVVGFLGIQLYSVPLIRMFNSVDQELIKVGAKSLRIFLLMLPVIGFQVVGAGYFQAIGKPMQSAILSLSRQVILLLPALLILPGLYGFDGVLFAGPVSDLGSAVLTGVWLVYELRHLEAKHREGQELEPETA